MEGKTAEVTDGDGAERVMIKAVDMSPELQQVAFEIAKAAKAQSEVEKDIATYIKREFDKRYGATWHCVVGRNFGSYVTHGLNLNDGRM